MPFWMPPMPFQIPPLFNTAVKDICAINTFEKLLNILFSEVYCWHFGFRRLLFSATITDMSLYELLNLFTRWPLVCRSFLHPPLVARDVVTPKWDSEIWITRAKKDFIHWENLNVMAKREITLSHDQRFAKVTDKAIEFSWQN